MPAPSTSETASDSRSRAGVVAWLPVTLTQAAHPRVALAVTAGLSAGAAASGRPLREVVLVAATALVGMVLIGWHNDTVDAGRDTRHQRADKPIAAGRLDLSTLRFSIAIAILALIPLSIAHGMSAGLAWLSAMAFAAATNTGFLRNTRFSYLPWMASFGLMPAFLSYGGWNGVTNGGPPELLVVALAALLGIGVHLLVSLPGLVLDREDGLTSLPLWVALKTGTPRLLLISVTYTAALMVALAAISYSVGLTQ